MTGHTQSRVRVTQADVARVAGVSQATVSLVLNDVHEARIAPSTRSRVLEAIRITGYVANPFAQSLAGGRTGIFGVFTYELSFPVAPSSYYQPILAGIESEAEQAGVDLLLYTSAQVHEGRRQLLGHGWNRLAVTDGCILIGRHRHRAELERLLDSEFPFVFVGRRDLDDRVVPWVAADYSSATQEVVRRLVTLGHERIIYVGDTSDHEPTADRLDGLKRASLEYGISPIVLDVDDANAYAVLDIALRQSVTALLLGAEVDPSEIHRAALDAGVAVPSDVSVAVLGESEIVDTGPLVWSGFSTPRHTMGREAVRILAAQLDAEDSQTPVLQRMLPCDLIAGNSVARPPE